MFRRKDREPDFEDAPEAMPEPRHGFYFTRQHIFIAGWLGLGLICAIVAFTTKGAEFFFAIIGVVALIVILAAWVVIRIKSDTYIGLEVTEDHLEEMVTILELPWSQEQEWNRKVNVPPFINRFDGSKVYFVEKIDFATKTITSAHNIKYTSVSYFTDKKNNIQLREENAWLYDKLTWLSFQLPLMVKRDVVLYLEELNQTILGRPQTILPHYYWKDKAIDGHGTRIPSILRGPPEDLEPGHSREDYEEYRKKLKDEYEKSNSRKSIPEYMREDGGAGED